MGRGGPTLLFDFTGGSLDSRITASGGANGTRVNASGSIVTATAPRFDYDPVSHAALGLLVEPARTNLALRSTDISAAAWGVSGVTVADATTFLEWADTNSHQISQSITFAATTYQVYADIKPTGRQWVRILIFDGTNYQSTWFDVVNGVVGSTGSTGGTAPVGSISASVDGMFRCKVTQVTAAGAGLLFICGAAADGGQSDYLGDSAKGYTITNVQIEAGASATSPIQTAGATVERTADVISLTIPAWVGHLVYTFDDDSTQTVSVSPGAYTVPTNLNRARIKSIRGVA